MNIYQFSPLKNKAPISLEGYKDTVLLIVNVASKCGFTPQYSELQEIKEKFKDSPFEILAFPSNEFGSQEPGTNEEILNFCTDRFGVSFPIFDKTMVNDNKKENLFTFLKETCPGILGSKKIKWNFTKFLVNSQGMPIERELLQHYP